MIGNSTLVCSFICVVYVSVLVFFPQSQTRGTVNGISQSLVAIGRSVGPVLGSVLFAWSESSGKY